MVLESRYYTRRVGQRYSRSLRHNSREFLTGYYWAPIPQKAAEEVLEAWYYTRHWCRGGPRGLVLPDTGVGVVLGAWCYTKAAGTEVIHEASTSGWVSPSTILPTTPPPLDNSTEESASRTLPSRPKGKRKRSS